MEQINIFDVIFEAYKSKRQINVIELFAGYGSTTLALKYLGANYRHHKICEWAINSIIAYASVHRNELEDYGNNFCGDLSKEQIAQLLCDMGVSINYNTPATLEQLNKVNEDKLRLCFNSIMWSNNLVDITKVKGKDLAIEREREYWLFYSFPCQDLSSAGLHKGLKRDSNTRSSLLWEVERILDELENKPQVLIMENVLGVHQADNSQHFKEWQLFLDSLGYQSYWSDISATDCKIPQSRNRCFMISILGNYNYRFPKQEKLELEMNDMLEQNVDKKYYITEKQINEIKQWNSFEQPFERLKVMEKTKCSLTITTRTSEYTSSMILVEQQKKEPRVIAGIGEKKSNNGTQYYQQDRIYDNKIALTVTTSFNPYYVDNSMDLKFRKLTPREAFRLQGVKDTDIDLLMENQTNSSCYHLAGDSICVSVLMAIYSTILDKNWVDYFNPKEWWNIN